MKTALSTSLRTLIWISLVATCQLITTPALSATYTYTGNAFDEYFDSSVPAGTSYEVGQSITIPMELSTPLTANLTTYSFNSSVVAFTATGRELLLTEANATIGGTFSTDANGITEWFVQASTPIPGTLGGTYHTVQFRRLTSSTLDTGVFRECSQLHPVTGNCGFTADSERVLDNPGSWTGTPIAGSAAMLRRQAAGAVPLIRPTKTTHLPGRQAQHPGRLTLRQPLLDHTLDHAHPVQLLVAQRHRLHARGKTPAGWRKRTLLSGYYSCRSE